MGEPTRRGNPSKDLPGFRWPCPGDRLYRQGVPEVQQDERAFKDLMLGQQEMIQSWRVKMLEGILTVVEAWAKINPRMKSVAKELKKMLDNAKNNYNQTAKEIEAREIRPKLKADKKDAEAKIRDINRQLTKTHNKKTESKLRARKEQAEAAIRRINGLLNQLHGKEAVTWIRTNRITYYGSKGSRPLTRGAMLTAAISVQRPWADDVAARSWWARRARRS